MKTANHLLMVELLIDQYRSDSSLRGYIAAQLQQSQEIEEASQEVAKSRDIDQAVGVSLDVIGILVGQQRNGQTDDVYRVFLKARILVNVGNGRGEEILDLLTQTVPDGGSFSFYEMYPAGLFVRLYETDSALASAISGLVCKIKAAGIGCTVSLTPDLAGGFFYGANSPGFGSSNSAITGGAWTGLI